MNKYTETKFSAYSIVSIYSNIMLTSSFDEIHEAFEAISDGPLFTHQLVQVQPFLAQLLEQEFPQLSGLQLPPITADSWEDVKKEVDVLINKAFPLKEYFLPVHSLQQLVDE